MSSSPPAAGAGSCSLPYAPHYEHGHVQGHRASNNNNTQTATGAYSYSTHTGLANNAPTGPAPYANSQPQQQGQYYQQQAAHPAHGHDTEHEHEHGVGHSGAGGVVPSGSVFPSVSPPGVASQASFALLRELSVPAPSLWSIVRRSWTWDSDASKLGLYIAFKCALTLMQFLYGVSIANLTFISASFHTIFDAVALAIAAAAYQMDKQKQKFPYTYGYSRFEVMAGFTNAIFLFFVATFLVIESCHTLYSPPTIQTDDLVLTVVGLVIDFVGMSLFQRFRHIDMDEDTDGITHAAYLVAALALHTNGIWYGFGVGYFVTCIIVIRAVYPLFSYTGVILLMTTPAAAKNGIERCVREISFYDGVLEVRSAHWWTLTPGVLVGSVHVRIRSDANEQYITAYIHSVLQKHIQHLTVQAEKDLPVTWSSANNHANHNQHHHGDEQAHGHSHSHGPGSQHGHAH